MKVLCIRTRGLKGFHDAQLSVCMCIPFESVTPAAEQHRSNSSD